MHYKASGVGSLGTSIYISFIGSVHCFIKCFSKCNISHPYSAFLWTAACRWQFLFSVRSFCCIIKIQSIIRLSGGQCHEGDHSITWLWYITGKKELVPHIFIMHTISHLFDFHNTSIFPPPFFYFFIFFKCEWLTVKDPPPKNPPKTKTFPTTFCTKPIQQTSHKVSASPEQTSLQQWQLQ